MVQRFNKPIAKVEELYEISFEDVKTMGVKDPESMAMRQTEARLVKQAKSFEKQIKAILFGCNDMTEFNEKMILKAKKTLEEKGRDYCLANDIVDENGTFLNQGFNKGTPITGKNYQQTFWGLVIDDDGVKQKLNLRAKSLETATSIKTQLGKVIDLMAIKATNKEGLVSRLYTAKSAPITIQDLTKEQLFEAFKDYAGKVNKLDSREKLIGYFETANKEPFAIDGLMLASANLEGSGKRAVH